jgi:hypothetical protein
MAAFLDRRAKGRILEFGRHHRLREPPSALKIRRKMNAADHP